MGAFQMKRVLIALFIALVLFCANGGLERFADVTGLTQTTQEMDG
jgi:hypothetical protein